MFQPGHFIPKFTSFNWALCLPAACSAEDAEHALESTLKDYNGTVGIKFMVNVDPNMCYVKQKFQTYSKETIGVLCVSFYHITKNQAIDKCMLLIYFVGIFTL